MAKEDKDWGSVEVPENETTEDKIEYEVEEESKVEAKEETVVESPEELEGIETKGAQKRIRHIKHKILLKK